MRDSLWFLPRDDNCLDLLSLSKVRELLLFRHQLEYYSNLFVSQVPSFNQSGQYKYSYYLGSTLTDLTFRSYLYNSLAYGRVPLLHAKTGALSYYNGHNTGHYIAVSKIDHSTMQVRLNDPNNNSSYYGTHYVSLSEALSCIHDYSSRYLICYWP